MEIKSFWRSAFEPRRVSKCLEIKGNHMKSRLVLMIFEVVSCVFQWFSMVGTAWAPGRGCRFRTVGGCTARESLSRKSRVGFEPGPRRFEGLLGRKKAPKRLRRGSEGAAQSGAQSSKTFCRARRARAMPCCSESSECTSSRRRERGSELWKSSRRLRRPCESHEHAREMSRRWHLCHETGYNMAINL